MDCTILIMMQINETKCQVTQIFEVISNIYNIRIRENC